MNKHLERVITNIGRYASDLQDWFEEMHRTLTRLRKGNLNSDDREHFIPHVLANILPETFRRLARILSIVVYMWIAVEVYNGLFGVQETAGDTCSQSTASTSSN